MLTEYEDDIYPTVSYYVLKYLMAINKVSTENKYRYNVVISNSGDILDVLLRTYFTWALIANPRPFD